VSDAAFELHPQLAADTIELARWPLCRVLLMNDRTYPWLILVPQLPGLREIFDLDANDRGRLMEETAHAARLLAELTQADKTNVAALGNMVPQLHIHVIARFATDPAWPGPVWGKVPAEAYDPVSLNHTLAALSDLLTRPPRNLRVVSENL